MEVYKILRIYFLLIQDDSTPELKKDFLEKYVIGLITLISASKIY
jgi:hypothetical protein